MPPRIIATGLGGAAIYAGVLGVPAAAQSAAPAVTATATASPAPTATASPSPSGSSSAAATGSPASSTSRSSSPAATAAPNAVSPGAGSTAGSITPAPNRASAVGVVAPARHPAAASPRGGNVAAGSGTVAPVRTAAPKPKPAKAPGAATAPAQIAPVVGGSAPAWAPIAAHVSVPASSIADFQIPPFLLPIYQAAGSEYGVPWEVLAAINQIETRYGRDLGVSSAGARGWMQFMPATWRRYGVDANGDGRRDPWNPVDAIFSAARYLQAAGASSDLRRAVLAYNHAGWYADSVLANARVIAGLPGGLVDALSGLTSGEFPIGARSSYADAGPRAIRIVSRPAAPVVAVADGRVLRLGRSRASGRFVVLRDLDGNTFTYGNLGSLPRMYRRHVFRRGTRVRAGATIAHLARRSPQLRFTIRPAGHGAPLIDPRPILDGWQLLAAASAGRRPFADVRTPSVGQLLLMSRGELIRRVLSSPRIQIYPCGRADVASGRIDRRVLVTMLYLADSGLRPRISALECGHSLLTTSGNVSEHSTGTAMDIAAVNGVTITPATQGPGTITDVTIRRLLTLQGVMAPHQIISLMTFAGASNTLAMADHADHIHVGWRPLAGLDPLGGRPLDAALRPDQWSRLTDRLEQLGNPAVPER